MKKYFVLLLLFAAAISTPACSKQEEVPQIRVKPVKTMEIKEQESLAVLSYTGIVGSGEVKELAFKSAGRVEEICVEKGQKVKKGDVLVRLEDKDLRFALAAAEGQMEAARFAYEKALNGPDPEEIRNAELNEKKARDAYDYAVSSFKRVEALYGSGAVSKDDLEKSKLELDIRESELRQAEEALSRLRKGAREEDKKALFNQLEQARADYEYRASLVQDAVMISDIDGYVVDILYEKGELVPAGYPVVVVRTEGLIVNVGLAEKDLAAVKAGAKAKVFYGEKKIEGTVVNISQVPDARTRTYNAEIAVEDSSLNLGAVLKAEIITGSEIGIWIPIASMLSDGTDYVFLAKDNAAEKREIVIERIEGNMVKVKGLLPGEQLVVEGMKRLRAGDAISVIK